MARAGERRALKAFQRAAARVPAYRTILAEQAVDPRAVRTIDDFREQVPVLDKAQTFGRFPLAELCRPGAIDALAAVLTSSGQGRRFSFGLTTAAQARREADHIDLGLAYVFAADRRRTLLINCLSMGVRVVSELATVAEVSVREDMALALATNFGPYYDQVIFVGDPLFLKRLSDAGRDQGLDWSATNVNLIIGEETFGENFRDYLAEHFNIDPARPEEGLIVSSMGVGELGLNLFHETRESVALRRRAAADEGLSRALFGDPAHRQAPPMLFVYNPQRTLVEVVEPGADGFGALTVTVADRDAPLPLIRYRTGDVARPIDPAAVRDRAEVLPRLPMVALLGREGSRLPDGRDILAYKDALYRDRAVARRLSGAFRLQWDGEAATLHVQLRPQAPATSDLAARLAEVMPGGLVPERIRLWPYRQFPFGMTLDHERKFSYVADDSAVGA